MGVTTDASPHIVYFSGPNLEAVPLAGGTPVVLATGLAATDYAVVSGGAVAWFTGQDATTKLFAATHVWTKASGQKDIVSGTHGLFTASEDGTRIAVEVAATDDLSAQLAVASSASPVITSPALSGANAVNLKAYASGSCSPELGFASNVFIGAFCTGTASDAVNARLVTVGAADTAATVRIDDAVAGVYPLWTADTSGTKIAVGDRATGTAKVLITAGATTTVGMADAAAGQAIMSADGSRIVYVTPSKELKRATVAATPVVSVLGTGVLGIHAASADRNRVAYYTKESGAGDYDVLTIDASSAMPTPTTLVATPVAYGVEFTGSGANVVYLDSYIAAGTGKLKSKPWMGGTEVLLDPASFAVLPSPTGNGLLSVTAVVAAPGGTSTQRAMTVAYVDAQLGGALKTGASNVLVDTDVYVGPTFGWSGKTFVHSTVGAAAGVSKLVLP